jgi:hypothetical protein
MSLDLRPARLARLETCPDHLAIPSPPFISQNSLNLLLRNGRGQVPYFDVDPMAPLPGRLRDFLMKVLQKSGQTLSLF